MHTETWLRPADLLAQERASIHRLPGEPYAAALGETRMVRDDQTVRFGNVRYSLPGGLGGRHGVWCRVQGDELVICGHGDAGLTEIWRQELSTPSHPRVLDCHYPTHPAGNGPPIRALRPADETERAFCALGEGAERWLREACATGVTRVRAKMTTATELAALLGADAVDRALGTAALAGRFAEDDLASILSHLAHQGSATELVRADEAHSAQPGTAAWEGFGR